MTAVTLTELSTTDIPVDVKYGTPKRRKMVFIRCTSAAVSDTLLLTTYIPEAADIEGIFHSTLADAMNATAHTWSTVTLTTAGGAGVLELGIIVNCT